MSTVTARYTDAQGNPASGTVYISPAARAGIGEPPDIVTEKRVWADLDAQGRISIDVIPSDDPGWLIDGEMPYLVEERLMGLPFRSYWIGVPDAGVDLSAVQHADPDVAPMPVPGPQGPPGIQGPEGPQGPPGEDFTPADADARYVNATGDTMTGALIVPAPTAISNVPRLARTPNAATGDLGLPGYAGSDTGIRDLTSHLTNGWAQQVGSYVGFGLRRIGQVVYINGYINGSAATAPSLLDILLPYGFRVSPPSFPVGVATRTAGAPLGAVAVTNGHTPQIVPYTSLKVANLGFNLAYTTDNPWPESLPGVQASAPASWT